MPVFQPGAEFRKDFDFKVLNRIALVELDAWFFGDVLAIHQAYEKIPITLGTKSAYRDPDSIKSGT